MTQAAPPEVQPQVYRDSGIRTEELDDDAIKVIARLRRKGHAAFLVGGCVRDLLLRRRPKDFDVATSARPRQIKSLFRNCRIIGRRFKLAHVHFEDKILEVSTFRRRPDQEGEDDDDLLIKSDNAFGTANEDAHRRDFTINGLFLDPEEDTIHDYVGGMDDIVRGVVRTIGDPVVRMREDPVRILRAIKFASRLSLRIDEATWDAMRECAEELSRSAAPRLLEELTRLLRGGHSLAAFQRLRDCGALRVLLPELDRYLEKSAPEDRRAYWRRLEALDARVRLEPERVNGPLVFGALLYPLLEQERDERRRNDPEQDERESDLGRLAESVLSPVLKRLNFSRHESGRLKRISVVQRRFEPGGKPRRNFRAATFMRQDYFDDALELFRLRCVSTEDGWTTYDEWDARRAEQNGEESELETIQRREAEAEREAAGLNGHSDDDRGTSRRSRRGRRSKARDDKAGRGRSDRRSRSTGQDAPSRGKRGERSEPKKKRKKRRGKRGESSDEPIELLPMPALPDISLDPSVVPTYGSVLGDTGSQEKINLEMPKGKRARKREAAENKPYTPPPPPSSSGGRRGGDDDTFGDW